MGLEGRKSENVFGRMAGAQVRGQGNRDQGGARQRAPVQSRVGRIGCAPYRDDRAVGRRARADAPVAHARPQRDRRRTKALRGQLEDDARQSQEVHRTLAMQRRFGLLQATALNMNNMMGIGPFITIPLLMSALGGPQAMLDRKSTRLNSSHTD